MIQLYTIGFTHKSAAQFFGLLQQNGVTQLIDTRINNTSQLAGFAKGSDLAYFTKAIANIDYIHNIDMAPTKDLLEQYRKKQLTWEAYTVEYLNLLDRRKLAQKINIDKLHCSCLLCSEHTPEQCHRRLLAEYLQNVRNDISINHLI